MEKINWTDRVRNEELLLRVKESRNIVHTAKMIGQIVPTSCFHNTLLKGRERERVTVRRGRRSKHLLDYFKERRGC